MVSEYNKQIKASNLIIKNYLTNFKKGVIYSKSELEYFLVHINLIKILKKKRVR